MPKIDWNSMIESTTSEYPLFLEMLTKMAMNKLLPHPPINLEIFFTVCL